MTNTKKYSKTLDKTVNRIKDYLDKNSESYRDYLDKNSESDDGCKMDIEKR